MEQSTLVGCSILVVEEGAFAARCLQLLLEGAGAEVYNATTGSDALRFLNQEDLSAAVLDHSGSANNGHRIPKRLTALGVPFVFCKEVGHNEVCSRAPALDKPVNGAKLVETLRHLLQSETAEVAERGIEKHALKQVVVQRTMRKFR